MASKLLILLMLFLCCSCISSENVSDAVDNVTTIAPVKDGNGNIDVQAYRARLDRQIESFEKGLKKIIKDAVKNIMPTLLKYNGDDSISTKCTGAMMKYIGGLTSVKVWAIRMLDATSKPSAGLFHGTVSDFGSFDQCLSVEFPKRNGAIEFRGQFCALEARPFMLPTPNNFSMAKNSHANPLDNIGREIYIAGAAMNYLKFRFGICVPSTCTLEDMQSIARLMTNASQMEVKIPKCYVTEAVTFKPIHIAVISVMAFLLFICVIGTIIEYQLMKTPKKRLSTCQKIFKCFSLISNFQRLMCSSKGSEELKALHGLRTISMGWIMLGHTYVWISFSLSRSPKNLVDWFNRLDFEPILNGWLSVEPFFFLSGLLTSYTVLKVMEKTKGKLNVPVYILRRYIRLTPPLLLTIGLLFFLPLISSGPFWYERVDPELQACTNYWWTSIIYISNWTPMKNICVHPTWYLSADFQLHVFSIVVFYALYKYPKLGFSLICSIVLACSVAIGALTFHYNLPPTIQISSGNNRQIQETIDIIHMKTFTHVGPYYVGIVLGYLMIKYKDIKIPRVVNMLGWCTSTMLCITSVYGAHRWNIGEPHGPLLTSIFAAVHRTTFTMGVAWVTFACVTGHGGLVNKFLSSSILTPVSRLTFMVYLLHSLVIWVRKASLRERVYLSHYNVLYEYIGNVVTTLILTVPFYLLLEAPLSNLERLAFSGARPSKEEKEEEQKQNGEANVVGTDKEEIIPTTVVELTGVKSLDLVQNGVVLTNAKLLNGK